MNEFYTLSDIPEEFLVNHRRISGQTTESGDNKDSNQALLMAVLLAMAFDMA